MITKQSSKPQGQRPEAENTRMDLRRITGLVTLIKSTDFVYECAQVHQVHGSCVITLEKNKCQVLDLYSQFSCAAQLTAGRSERIIPFHRIQIAGFHSDSPFTEPGFLLTVYEKSNT